MLDIDTYPSLYWQNTIKGDTGFKNLTSIIRQNDKILVDAQNKTYEYAMKQNRLGWTFENLFRSIGLATGVLAGGPLGGATMGAIGGGFGRGIGEHVGNKIYGEAVHDLDKISEDYKFRQLNNQYAMNINQGQSSMLDEMYTQSMQREQEVAQSLAE